MCAVTLSSRSRIAWRNPVFIESAITRVVTPAATPITASKVTMRNTAGRFGDRRYRSATSHSKLISLCRLIHFHPQLRTQPRRRQQHPAIPRAAMGTAPLRVSHANPSAASPTDQCPRLRLPSAAGRAPAHECNPCPLLSALLAHPFPPARENAVPVRMDRSTPKIHGPLPPPPQKARSALSGTGHQVSVLKAAKSPSESHI